MATLSQAQASGLITNINSAYKGWAGYRHLRDAIDATTAGWVNSPSGTVYSPNAVKKLHEDRFSNATQSGVAARDLVIDYRNTTVSSLTSIVNSAEFLLADIVSTSWGATINRRGQSVNAIVNEVARSFEVGGFYIPGNTIALGTVTRADANKQNIALPLVTKQVAKPFAASGEKVDNMFIGKTDSGLKSNVEQIFIQTFDDVTVGQEKLSIAFDKTGFNGTIDVVPVNGLAATGSGVTLTKTNKNLLKNSAFLVQGATVEHNPNMLPNWTAASGSTTLSISSSGTPMIGDYQLRAILDGTSSAAVTQDISSLVYPETMYVAGAYVKATSQDASGVFELSVTQTDYKQSTSGIMSTFPSGVYETDSLLSAFIVTPKDIVDTDESGTALNFKIGLSKGSTGTFYIDGAFFAPVTYIGGVGFAMPRGPEDPTVGNAGSPDTWNTTVTVDNAGKITSFLRDALGDQIGTMLPISGSTEIPDSTIVDISTD